MRPVCWSSCTRSLAEARLRHVFGPFCGFDAVCQQLYCAVVHILAHVLLVVLVVTTAGKAGATGRGNDQPGTTTRRQPDRSGAR
jgi:hypothetical protein